MDNLELDRIVFLLNDDNFKDELKTFRRSYQRLRVRLRNTRLSGELKQVKTLIHKLEVEFPVALFEHYRTKKPKQKSLQTLILRLSKFITALDVIITRATVVYGKSQPHFRVGHLIQHYLVIRASLARLIFCFKALLVYAVDLFSSLDISNRVDLSSKEDAGLLTQSQARDILIKHGCKPKQVCESESPEVIEQHIKPESNDPIGELIDRETMRPVRTCRRSKHK